MRLAPAGHLQFQRFVGLVQVRSDTLHFLGAKLDQASQGAIILARAAGFMARQEFEHTGLVGKAPDSVGGARGRVWVYALSRLRLFSDLAGDAGTFQIQETSLTPEADGHVLDEGGFDSGARLEFVVEFVEEGDEVLLRFALDQQDLGEHSVADCVAGGFQLPGGRDGSPGFRTVCAGGENAAFRFHTTRVSAPEKRDLARLGWK